MRSIFNNEINLITPDDVAAEKPSLQIVDRRLNGKNKSIGNRERFIKRYDKQIGEAVRKKLTGKVGNTSGQDVSIPKRDLNEPTFGHARSGGNREYVHPGNKEYISGDKIARPKGGGGGGGGKGEASDSGEGEDDFTFTLTREEFMKYFFEGLELPNLLRTVLSDSKKTKPKTAGFRTSGNPEAISIIRTSRQALARRIALGAGPSEARQKMIEEEIERLSGLFNDLSETDKVSSKGLKYYEEIDSRERILSRGGKRVPYLDPIDLRFRGRTQVPVPEAKAVMFCLMDVSGSMDEARKDLSKRFFMLLSLFLQSKYETVELVFLRHHTEASEVNEEEFFQSKETGGTKVSSVLRLMANIMKERYSGEEWNIYGAQASDGDNFRDDMADCISSLKKDILPFTRHFAYMQVAKQESDLWTEYKKLEKEMPGVFAAKLAETQDKIYPSFREFFEKKDGAKMSAMSTPQQAYA